MLHHSADLHTPNVTSAHHQTKFKWLYATYWQPLLDHAYYYLRDYSVAEEIVQQLFIDLYVKDILEKDITNVSGYLKKAVKNRICNYVLKNKRYRYHLKNLSGKSGAGSYNPVDNDMNVMDRQKEIAFYLSQLSESCRTVFLLNREQQMTIRQISSELQRPVDTVTKQLSKAVRHLYHKMYVQQGVQPTTSEFVRNTKGSPKVKGTAA